MKQKTNVAAKRPQTLSGCDIKTIRKIIGLTQKELADLAQVRLRAIQRWEHAEIVDLASYAPHRVVRVLAIALNKMAGEVSEAKLRAVAGSLRRQEAQGRGRLVAKTAETRRIEAPKAEPNPAQKETRPEPTPEFLKFLEDARHNRVKAF